MVEYGSLIHILPDAVGNLHVVNDQSDRWLVGDIQNTDPKLGPLTNNGGTTLTHLPRLGSPLIDAGTLIDAPTTDQRDAPRPIGLTVDIGAVERQPDDIDSILIYLPIITK